MEVIAFGEQDQGREAWGWGLLVVIISFVVQLDILYSYLYYIDSTKMQIIYIINYTTQKETVTTLGKESKYQDLLRNIPGIWNHWQSRSHKIFTHVFSQLK